MRPIRIEEQIEVLTQDHLSTLSTSMILSLGLFNNDSNGYFLTFWREVDSSECK